MSKTGTLSRVNDDDNDDEDEDDDDDDDDDDDINRIPPVHMSKIIEKPKKRIHPQECAQIAPATQQQ
ncbi:hypothetical protein VTJ04DRAFT_3193 [Mycothermus thermophilus]|uniref:uncharacterized protein n=1 Tax=Humicola insolens TaxID=85995 RepID=UPI003742858C